jgi:hypothetical protein
MGTFVEPSLPKDNQTLKKVTENSIGAYNEHGDLFLEIYEI